MTPTTDDVDETPTAALMAELVNSYAWRQVQARLIARRDQMVASLAAGETFQPKTARSKDGGMSIAAEESGVILARIAERLGFIRALNEMAATPDLLLKQATEKLEKAKA